MGTKIKFSNKGMSAKPASVSSVVFEVPVYLQNWALQTTWFIDTAAGDDNNSGAIASAPLKTWAEFRRRVPSPQADMTITIAAGSSFATTDPMVWQPINQQSQAAGITISIVGTRTRTPLPVAAASNALNVATGTPPTIDLGTALTVGSIIEAGATGFTAVVMFLISGTNYATTEWCDSLGANQGVPAPGSAMSVLTMPTCARIGITNHGFAILVSNMNFATFDPIVCDDVTIIQSILPAFVGLAAASGATGSWRIHHFMGCSITSGAGVMGYAGLGWAAFYLCGVFAKMLAQESTVLDIRRTIIAPATATFGLQLKQNASIRGAFNLGIYNTTTAALDVQGGSQFGADNSAGSPGFPIYGLASKNTGKGTLIRSGGRFFYPTGSTMTLFATGQELELESSAVAIPALVAGATVPAASTLTTWAQLSAPPFYGSVTSLSGSAVIMTFA
jgi:hypothetical protein